MKKSSTNTKCTGKLCALIGKIKPYYYYILVAIIAFILGLILKSMTCSSGTAFVDVQKIIENSTAIQELQADFAPKQAELQQWVSEAQAKVNKYKDGEAKQKLISEFETEFAQKQQAIQKEYNEKLRQIDEDTTKIIKKAAKSKGYCIVLNKNAVITGGTDITDEIIKFLK